MSGDAPAAWNVEVPFAVCACNGGPFDDAAFVAGYQIGRVTAGLEHAAEIDATSVSYTLLRCLVSEAEVAAMSHGFPYVFTEPCADSSEWAHIVMSTVDSNPFADEPADPA